MNTAKTLLASIVCLSLVACAADPAAPGRDGRDGEDGKTGEAGRNGQDGVTGAQGVQGATGPSGPALPLTKARMAQRVSSPITIQPINNDPNRFSTGMGSVSAFCALTTDIVITGGCLTAGAHTTVISASYPANAQDSTELGGWTCRASQLGGGVEGTLVAYVVCATP